MSTGTRRFNDNKAAEEFGSILSLSAFDLRSVPTISREERSVLLDAARSFHEIPTPVRRQQPPLSRRSRSAGCRHQQPGDDFNDRASWPELLEARGWAFLYDSGGVEHWARPGKVEGTGATVNHAGADLLHVFTSNAPPLEQDASYNKFGFYTLMEHDGDFL